MRTKIQVLLSIIALAISSCNNYQYSEYILDVNNNDKLNKEYRDVIFNISCAYRPPAYMALIELRSSIELNKRITVEEFSKLKNSFSNGAYFILSIGLNDSSDIMRNGVKDLSDYSQRINEIAFSIGTNTYLLNDKRDTIRSTIQDFQRSYGMSPRATILFAFPRNQLDNSEWVDLIYNDKYFGIEKSVAFKFQTKHILKKAPELSFNNND